MATLTRLCQSCRRSAEVLLLSLKASLVINCARPDGLVPPVECAATQDFQEPWELVVVNWGYGEQDELLQALWRKLRPDVPLRHVPLLPPCLGRSKYGSWDLGTTYNTAWAHAQGEFSVFIEDYWVFRPDWLRTHIDRVRMYPDQVIIGGNYSRPTWDENAPFHYGVDAVIMVNFSHKTEYIWRGDGLGAPEWPTRHPETTILPFVLLNRGATVGRHHGAKAWHVPHYPDGCVGHIMQKGKFTPDQAYANPDGTGFSGVFQYYEVEQIDNGHAYIHPHPPDWNAIRRNIREERLKLGYWV